MDIALQNRIENRSTPEPNSGCWLWDNPSDSNGGYGMLTGLLAHRASYTAFVGAIPSGKVVMHKCDTRACVNPDHLVLGSRRDNIIDAHRKRRTTLSRASKEQLQAWARQTSIFRLRASAKGLSLSERIDRLSIPEPNTGCQLWTGSTTSRSVGKGYGVIKVSGRMCLAHRISYSANVGAIPEGMLVCHKCDTPACVNPDHLFVGTHSDNNRDTVKKGRSPFTRATESQRAEWTEKRLAREALEPGLRADMWEARRAKYGALGRANVVGKYSRDSSKKGWDGMAPEARADRVRKFQEIAAKSRATKSGRVRSFKNHGESIKKSWAGMAPEARVERVRKLHEARQKSREAKAPRLVLINLLRAP